MTETAFVLTDEPMFTAAPMVTGQTFGAQNINWSEHIYPLVALLNRAGYEGLPYPEARANLGTLLDFRDQALVLLRAARGEGVTHELHDRLAAFLDEVDR